MNKVFRDFKVGERVFLKLKEKRSSLISRSFLNLAARYSGPFEIFERIGPVAYMLALYASMRVHSVFHVSLLNKYVLDPNHINDWNVIHVEQEGDFQVEPVHILDQKVKIPRNKDIRLIKDQWIYYSPEYAT
jgi:hypothetical protein